MLFATQGMCPRILPSVYSLLASPELLLDNSRDFSIYVLDPLESQTMPAPVDFSQSNAAPASTPPVVQPRGVAVALGLMSWALTGDESDNVAVTGTITPLGTGLDALELVFALREVGIRSLLCTPILLNNAIRQNMFRNPTSLMP
jgi:hypothetical protein